MVKFMVLNLGVEVLWGLSVCLMQLPEWLGRFWSSQFLQEVQHQVPQDSAQ
uniref:Uncharacterized protein n=1 Tax=Anguilla anguilla TaxID=7936 RepID=A0A0E9WJM0_ANGAN